MLAAMKKDLHDRLWNAQQRWFAMRAEGATKRDLKLRGIREAQDANLHLRALIFTGSTKRAVEETLKAFVEFAHERFGARRLENIGKREFKAFIEDGIARGLAASTLEARCSHLSKYGALTGQSASYFALAAKYARRVRGMVRSGDLPDLKRFTPSPDVAQRAIEILRAWDESHRARTGQPRGYHLAARLQVTIGGRSVSVTERLTRNSLKGADLIEVIGKGGRPVLAPVPPDLYRAVAELLERTGVPLANRDGYRMAWRRAVQAARGKATGTHGLRRRAARGFYSDAYAARIALGMSSEEARREARKEAVGRLGHSRDRTDQAICYLGPAA